MKKILLISSMTFLFIGCSVNSSDNVNVDGEDIVYFKDTRTGLCFGAVATRKTGDVSATGIGMACVPCKEVEHLIK